MTKIKFIYILLLILICTNSFAQPISYPTNTTSYRAEAFGSAATGSNTPFWMVSNRYGVVPLEAGNGYLKTGVFHNKSYSNGLLWNAGIDLVGTAPRYRNFYLQQLYAEIGYKSFLLKIGNKEEYTSLWDRNLSSGDMVMSTNARPIPEINLSIPNYTIVPYTKEWLAIKGNFSVGKSFDSKYLEQFVNEKQVYVKDILWHHKSLYLRINDPKNTIPLTLEAGVQHWAQWGGTSNNDSVGVQPKSIKDFLRVVAGMSGDDNASKSDRVNVLGNHYGGYNLKLSYTKNDWAIHAYHQHFFEDKSGIELVNLKDGLFGIQLDLSSVSFLNKIVFEYIETRGQSGAFHFIDFDHDKYPGRGGGRDNYYNNEEYTTGASYFNRALGSALLTSPEYNKDRKLGFKNNRINGFHVGMEGEFSTTLGYRFLFTKTNGWGTPEAPFLNKKTATCGLLDITYQHPKLSGWLFKGSLASDTGTMYGKGTGVSFSIAKQGLLKSW